MGLVHAWASGTSWVDVIANTSLDEGDVVRILRRTVDLLAQVPYAEALSEQLRTTARKALNAINRFPVCELQDLPGATAVVASNPAITIPEPISPPSLSAE
jgi:superfamily II RNA helicase